MDGNLFEMFSLSFFSLVRVLGRREGGEGGGEVFETCVFWL